MIVSVAFQPDAPGPAQKILGIASVDRHPRRLHVEQVMVALGPVGHAAVEAGFVEQLDPGDQVAEPLRGGEFRQVPKHGDAGCAAANDADDHDARPLQWASGYATQVCMTASWVRLGR